MNILVVSDNFTKGGLEIHIATFWNHLRENNNFCFCVANYEDRGLIDNSSVYTGFHFTFHETLADLKEDVSRLISVIKEKKIDVIHVHPWFGLYAAYFAASLTGVKLVYTYHGTVSINYNGNMYDELFMQEIIASTASHVFCVSRQGQDALQSINCTRTTLLNNPIVMNDYPVLSITGSHKWALVSRLDSDKAPSVIKFLKMLPDLNIDKVDIYGEGDNLDIIKNLAKETSKELTFYGHRDDVIEKLANGDYDGVIGLGRCAIEGLALGLPVLLIGYGKIIGLIDSGIYDVASQSNFITEGLSEKDFSAINEQIDECLLNPEKYNHRGRIYADFDVDSLSKIYVEKLNNSVAMGSTYAADLYNDIMKIPDPKNVLFHQNKAVWNVFCDRVAPSTHNIYVKDMIMLVRQIETVKEQSEYALGEVRTQVKDCASRIEEQSYAISRLASGIEELNSFIHELVIDKEEKDQQIKSISQRLDTEMSQVLQPLKQTVDGMKDELVAITHKIDSMGFRYFMNQSVEWRKNRLKEKK